MFYDCELEELPDEMIGILQTIAPEISGKPFYLVDTGGKNLAGASFRGCSLAFQNEIRAAGMWLGPGTALVLNTQNVYLNNYKAASSVGLNHRSSDKFARETILKTGIHELAHHLLECHDLQQPRAFRTEAVAKLKEVDAEHPEVEAKNPLPMKFHEAPFVRFTLNLVARANECCDLKLSPEGSCAGPTYCMSSATEYQTALGNEPRYLRAATVMGLHQFKPAQGFVDLWRSDVKRWYGSIPGEATPEQTDFAVEALQLYGN